MWVFFLMLIPALAPIFAPLMRDPAPGLGTTPTESRNTTCARLSEQEARRRFPGKVAEPFARGEVISTDAMACSRRVMDLGERRAQDEAILDGLGASSAAITEAAVVHADAGLTWLVDAYYPDPAVGAKLSFAAKTALVDRGQKVSDRLPALAAGDLQVLGPMSPWQAYRLACARWHTTLAMTDGEALLAVVVLDARETVVHAGVCRRGEWRWLP
jgi:hypothetical protein